MQILCHILWLLKADYFCQCTVRIWLPKNGLIANASVEREAMWINFNSHKPYAIKIFVGGVNVVSGEPAIETAAARLRRRTLLSQNKSIQDYLVVPAQPWIDGIATSAGKVRQFVAMPVCTGYSVEAQMAGEEVTGGIQFEVTPCASTRLQIKVAIEGKTLDLSVPENDRFSDLIDRLELEGGIQWTKEHRVYHDKNNQLEELIGPPTCVSPYDPLYTGGRDLRNFGLGNVCKYRYLHPDSDCLLRPGQPLGSAATWLLREL